jgi:restriction endonuclease
MTWDIPLPSPKRSSFDGLDHAVADLRALSRPDLDALVTAWLTQLGASSVRACDHRGVPTYQALLGNRPATTAIRVRVYQRRNRLQPHHVEAFIGHLVRHHVSSGILVTTGDFSWEAALIGRAIRNPQIRLRSGHEWAAELVERGVGVKRRSVWQWMVDLTHCSSLPRRRKLRGRR